MGTFELEPSTSNMLQLPLVKNTMSSGYECQHSMILEEIDESPCSKPQGRSNNLGAFPQELKVFEQSDDKASHGALSEVESGLPLTEDAPDIFPKPEQKGKEGEGACPFELAKQKSRSFADAKLMRPSLKSLKS